MPASRYMEENSSVAMLATKRSAGVAQEANFRRCVTTNTPLPSANKATHSGFESQRRHYQSKTGVTVAPQKDLTSSKK